MDIHIPFIFIYASFFLLSFYFLSLAMKSYQSGNEKWWSPWVMISGCILYIAGAVYTAEFVTFLTLLQAKFVFVIAAIILLLSYFFKWQKWVFYLYSAVVVLAGLELYYKFLPIS